MNAPISQSLLSQCLNGKRVLFLSPTFFGYELAIKSEMEASGASVDLFTDAPFRSPMRRVMTKNYPTMVSKIGSAVYLDSLKKIEQSYDYVLIINGMTVSRAVVDFVKQHSPSAKFILYMWDSIENSQSTRNILDAMDAGSGFDRSTCKELGLKYQPLFYRDVFDFGLVSDDSLYDVSFVGTAHSDRYKVCTSVKKRLGKNRNSYMFLYLQAHWVFWAARVLRPGMLHAKKDEFSYKGININETAEIFRRSRCILDIEHSRQRGLTMRTIETLGAQRKLITTNKSIEKEEFYNEENILIIDRKQPKIPDSFIDSPYRPIDQNLRRNYSLSGWLENLIC